ncbi:hypothetical protein [Actinopolymorpha singaporensis]|uniref:Uncharacterized protein n=1 Tax=Actinopolymorpha singaporensis TaxID=117157 RepID=A0A1H1L7D6_9ACTN|nr:hypothetical protein [Actinopolymorpha singaporensis]SDR70337.1 hypothetical protein SAMN04489717_0158 [Actinopolymorpha singaporensis]
MDKTEARRLAVDRIAELRQMSYAELRDRFLDQPQCDEVRAVSGTVYQVETEGFWDDQEAVHLRILVYVDDGGWAAFSPVGDSFIVAPDGSFVGE